MSQVINYIITGYASIAEATTVDMIQVNCCAIHLVTQKYIKFVEIYFNLVNSLDHSLILKLIH